MFKKGRKANIPILPEGEAGFTVDTHEFYIGSNNGNVRIPIQSDLDSLTSRFNNIFSDVKKDFGAKGDGSTNDTTSIQNAINYVATSGGVLFFPIGTYMVAKLKVPSNVILKGVYGLSILKLLSGQPAGSWVIQNTDFTNGNSNIVFDSLVLDGNASAYLTDINVTTTQFQKVTNLSFLNTKIKGGLADGLYAYSCTNLSVINCDTSNNGRFQVDGSGMNIDTCDNVNVLSTISNSNGFHGILVSGTTNSFFQLTGNSNGYDGCKVQFSANFNTFSGCTFRNNTQRGFYFNNSSTNNVVQGCKSHHNGFHGIVFNGSSNNTLMGNMLTNNSMNGLVTVVSTDTQKGTGNIISGNTSGDLSLASTSNFPTQ